MEQSPDPPLDCCAAATLLSTERIHYYNVTSLEQVAAA
jgi:hypothetical protein